MEDQPGWSPGLQLQFQELPPLGDVTRRALCWFSCRCRPEVLLSCVCVFNKERHVFVLYWAPQILQLVVRGSVGDLLKRGCRPGIWPFVLASPCPVPGRPRRPCKRGRRVEGREP